MVIVSDTSPIINLAIIGQLDLMLRLFHRLVSLACQGTVLIHSDRTAQEVPVFLLQDKALLLPKKFLKQIFTVFQEVVKNSIYFFQQKLFFYTKESTFAVALKQGYI